MKTVISWVLPFMLVAMAGYSAVHQRREASHAVGGEDSSNCSSCHEGSVQQTHVSEFLLESHGQAARADRQDCLGCHQPESCDDCHLDQAPLWHTEAFCNPGLSAENRDVHSSEGRSRRSDCLECHATRFFVQCGDCHDPLEWQ
ncbi:MAG TPA: hypothetical protein QF764_10225 [Planctomycetota bacterium]|nr:hypothetical protein [Planctomycetota bacterium]